MSKGEMSLVPYLHFEGDCEEAVKMYERIFHGKIEGIKRFGEGPMEASESHKNQVLHALLMLGESSLMASDTFPGAELTKGDNYALSIMLKDEDRAGRIFAELAKGGKVIMPFEKQFWGAVFGQLVDRFGIRWMINCENE